MKKFWMLFLTALLALSFCACQNDTADSQSGGLLDAIGGEKEKVHTVQVVETGSGITVMTAEDWADKYPEIYASYMENNDNTEIHEYTVDYPMLPVVYEGMAFSKFYGSARGHTYTVEDVTSTGRPHALANCFTCKTPDYTAMVNEMGDAAYQLKFDDVLAEINEPISCYNCHANTGDELVVTHTYLSDAMGEDLMSVAAEDLSCGQCHVEYYFDPATKATTLPYQNLATMTPDAILDYFNRTIVDGQVFADYVNPRSGVRQIKVQHPEFETYLGEGSVHAGEFTCADCHMGEAVAEDGTTYISHNWISPLENEALMENTCAECHTNLTAEVREIQAESERRTYAIGYLLEGLTEKLVLASKSGEYTDAELDAIRMAARNAQFYWDFVMVENAEGAHNSALTRECLDKAEALANEAMSMFK
ncbi:MAG: ammonia-forming cytochrome c nitrite reductase subunit c552 [Oscillospiraceae bacterium]|nr:ammonia-forming cytochrome c nitrite reductase subunit c552 [Oscillospiraceae bacterium]